MQEKRDGILALDFGTKKVGLAISHGFVAEPLKSVLFRDNEDAFFDKISEVVREQKVGLILVGLPLEEGLETKQSNWTRERATELSHKVDCEIEFIDEAFSTAEAIENLNGGGDVDSEAAKIILEQYLQSKK